MVGKPFLPSQYPLLHLLGILSTARTSDTPLNDIQDAPDALVLPQGLLFNALCFLTEQIHGVAPPYKHLEELLDDVSKLSSTIRQVKPPHSAQTAATPVPVPAQPARAGGRKSTARATPAKRVSISPATSRSLRNTASRNQHASIHDGDTSGLLQAEVGREAAKQLAERLRENMQSDVSNMQLERFEGLATSMDDFKALLGDFENPNSRSFLDKASPLALWLRRSLLNLRDLSYFEAEALIDDIIAFCKSKEEQNAAAPTQSSAGKDAALSARTDLFETYTKAMIKEDYSAALDAVLRFFDFETATMAGGVSNNRGMRQHALLNLASFHQHFSEHAAARQACSEGIKVARQAGDLIALSALTSLLRSVEIDAKQYEQKSSNGEGDDISALTDKANAKEDPGGYTNPMDYLRDIEFGQATRVALPALSCNLYRAKALHYSSMTTKTNLSLKEKRKEKKLLAAQGKDTSATGPDAQPRRAKWNRLDFPAWYDSAALLWHDMGIQSVSEVYGQIGLLLGREEQLHQDADPKRGARTALLCQQAQKLCADGAFEAGVAILLAELSASAQNGRTPSDMRLLVATASQCFAAEAKKRNFEATYHRCSVAGQASGRPSSVSTPGTLAPVTPRQLAYNGAPGNKGLQAEIASALQRGRKLLTVNQPAQALPLSTKALALSSLSDGQVFLHEHLEAQLLVARVQVAFKSPDRALRALDAVWVDILGSTDARLMGEAKVVRAECLLACVKQSADERLSVPDSECHSAMREAMRLLEEACNAFESIADRDGLASASAASAKLYDYIGNTAKRNEAAILWQESTSSADKKEEQRLLDQWSLIERFSAISSGRVAAR